MTLGHIVQTSTGGIATAPVIPYALREHQEVVIGREPSCDLALDPLLYKGVSRRHAQIRMTIGAQGPGWQIMDLGSANGTYVNGQQISGVQPLQSGDRFSLGENGPEFCLELQAMGGHTAASRAIAPMAPSHQNQVTATQLFPILSTGKDLRQKAFLWPAVLTVIFVILMFASIGEPEAFNLVLGTYLAGAAYYYIYQLCGKKKPWWYLVGIIFFTMILLVTPVLDLFILVFRVILPGNLDEQGGFISLFIGMFFGAGLMEELLKAIPIFIAYGVGKNLKTPWRERLGVWEPLDGILLGSASAVGFTLLETLGQYVPNMVSSADETMGLQLLIPRILGSVAGHMAYSGYFGYFIGLSVLKSQQRWLILFVGYMTASLLHALWNSVGYYHTLILAVVGVVSYAFLAAAILKARLLSPNRTQNFATRFLP